MTSVKLIEINEMAEGVAAARGVTPGSTALMDCFWGLASVSEASRVASAASLIRLLVASQKVHAATAADGSWGSDLEYCAKRLIRGLASPRDGARQGFSIAVAELIRAIPEFTVPKALDLIAECVGTAPKAAKSRDQKDMHFGHAFGLLAVVQSGRLESAPDCISPVLGKLLELCKLKAYLSDVCAEIAVDLVEALSASALHEHLEPVLSTVLPTDSPTKEEFAVGVALERRDVSVAELNWFEGRALGHPKDFAKVANLLSDAGGQTVAVPCWWIQYMRLVCTKAADPAVIHKFWDVVIETALFGEKRATVERKALGFKLLRVALPLLTAEQIPGLFTPHLMRSMITNLATPKNYLHAAAQKAIDAVTALATRNSEDANDELVLGIVGQLSSSGGSTRFDSLTKTKTVETLLANLTLEGVHTYIRKLFIQFVSADAVVEDGKAAADASREVESRRAFVVDQILALVRNRRVPRDAEWTLACAHFLFFNAYYDGKPPSAFLGVKQDMKSPLIETTRQLCADRWYTVTLELWNVRSGGDSVGPAAPSGGAAGSAISGESCVLKVVDYVMELETKRGKSKSGGPKRSPVNPLPETLAATLTELYEMIDRLHKRSLNDSAKGRQKATAAQAHAFKVLLLHVFVELFYSRGDAEIEMVGDLLRASTEIFESRADDGEEHDPYAVLVDILLSFLSRPSAAFRSVAAHVFGVVSPSLSLGAFSLLLEQLVSDGSVDDGDDGDAGDEDGAGGQGPSESVRSKRRRLGVDEDGNAAADSSESDGSVEEEGDEAEDAVESGDDSDDDNLDAEGGEVDPELRETLAQTLGVIGALPTESGDEDDQSDLSDWDDDRMMQLDAAIAAQFQLRKADSKGRKEEKRQSVNFKLRILDLVEVFARKQPESPLIFELFLPLLECANVATRGGDNVGNALRQRAYGTVKNKLCSGSKCPPVTKEESERVVAIATEVFKIASNSADTKEAECASLVVLYLLRALSAENSADDIVALYADALNDFASRKASRVRPAMLRQFCQRQPQLACGMLSQMAQAANTAINDFRCCQTLDLIRILLQQQKSDALSEALVASSGEIMNSVASALQKMQEGGVEKTKIKHIREILKFALYFVKRTSSVKVEGAAVANLRTAVTALAVSPHVDKSPPVKVACAQLVAVLPTDVKGDGSGKKRSKKSKSGKSSKS